MARGIPLAEARRLVIQGFFGQLIDQIEVPELRDRIGAAIERELGAPDDHAGGTAPGGTA
jgi:Fe-S cluster assembly protein SufD